MKLLLIAPRWPGQSLWGQIYFRFPYLALTTLAALTGDEWEISILDENVEPIDFSDLPDLAAISIMTPLAKRGYEIADTYRGKKVPVVLGGIHPTMMKDESKAHADSVVLGEAEEVWPQLLSDFKQGELKPFYKAQGFCSLKNLPTPKRNLLNRRAYFFVNTIQTTRGCPFDCEFCSVTSFYGRTYRVRPVEDVIAEMTNMEGGFVFFVDDNIAGEPSYVKQLFRALIPLKVKWFSQAALSIIKDKQLLDLAQKSGCKGLFIGFESLRQESLNEMGKSIHRVNRYKDAIKMIHDHGIGIQGSFIFGTDHDDNAIFSDVLRFVEKTHLEAVLFSVLTPFPGTRIQEALLRQDRILHTDWEKYDMNHVVFRPKQMTSAQLQQGLSWAYKRLYGYPSMMKRLFPFKRSALFYGIQNCGFRQAWRKTLKAFS
jgi:radical SAM superfamily enzyme YgiQ (UPF0313 family)